MTIEQEPPRHATVLDDDVRRVARVYAEALLSVAEQQGQAAAVLDDLNGLMHEVFDRNPQFELFLASAAIGRDRKAQAIRAAFGSTEDVLTKFLLVLNEHDRLGALRAVAITYRELYDQRSGRMQVRVQSAVPLTEPQMDRLRQELQGAFHKEPIVSATVVPELLGGMVVRVDDWVYDASVRTRLANLRKQLSERSSHEIQSGRDRFRSV
jgi:F-type H+-transporting ATPase subunit delta